MTRCAGRSVAPREPFCRPEVLSATALWTVRALDRKAFCAARAGSGMALPLSAHREYPAATPGRIRSGRSGPCGCGGVRMALRAADRSTQDASVPGVGRFLKRVVVGRSIETSKAGHALLPKTLAIAVLAPDPLSSVAYSVETMLLVLLGASAAALRIAFPVTLGVAALL